MSILDDDALTPEQADMMLQVVPTKLEKAAYAKGRADERERIAAWVEAQGWGRQDSVGIVTRSYAARIRNGEHETRSNDHPTSDNCTNDS